MSTYDPNTTRRMAVAVAQRAARRRARMVEQIINCRKQTGR